MSTQAKKLADQDKEWKLKYYSFLKGARIVNLEIFEDELFTGSDQNWPVIIIEKDNQLFELQISRDEEGNGPGFMFGLPHV